MEEVSTGTTIMAVEFDGGVVLGADSRTTSGTFIVNRVTDKLTRLTDHIYCCRSGSAADTQAVADIVRYRLKLFQVTNDVDPSVKAAATIFRNICYEYREQLTAGIICAGWDSKNGGQAYSIPLGGMMHREPVIVGGSGSSYIYGFADANFRVGMSEQECVDFVLKAVTLALTRDGSSGGCVRIGIVDKDGCRKKLYLHDELPTFYSG